MVETKPVVNLLRLKTSCTQENEDKVRAWEKARELNEKKKHHRKQVPERYWGEIIDTYRSDTEERRTAKTRTEAFMQAVERGKFQTLIFLGSVGTGKTHLASGIIYECGGYYRLASAIVEELRRAKSFNSRETEAEILEAYGRAELLVVDEIGRGAAAVEEQYMLYQIINERYNRRKPLVLISNQNRKDFFNYIGIAAADRLTESAQVVEFSGQSYRAAIRQSSRNP